MKESAIPILKLITQKIEATGIFLLKVHDRICYGCAYIGAWMMLGMAFIVAYEVTSRYFLNKPTSWAGDFTDYILFYSTFLAAAWLLKQRGHVNLTILLARFSERSQMVIQMINSFIGAIVSAIVIWYGVSDAWDAMVKGIVIDRAIIVPKYLLIGIIPVGFLLVFVQFIRDAFKSLQDIKGSS